MNPFQAAIFFDNDGSRLDQVKAVCKTIELVKVPETMPLRMTKFTDSPLKELVQFLDDNLYVKSLRDHGIDSDNYDEISGISIQHMMYDFMDWLEKTIAIQDRAALFDWDRTLTKFEGFFAEQNVAPQDWLEKNETTIEEWREEAVTYLCGGRVRLQMLRDMFHRAHSMGVTLFVLTNNTICGSSTFSNIMKKLFEDLPVKTICGRYYNFNKGSALQGHARFQNLCTVPPVSGGKRSKTRLRRVTRLKRGRFARTRRARLVRS